MTFEATGEGFNGVDKYGFEIEFCEEIDPKKSSYKIRARDICFTIQKAKAGAWQRLLSQSKTPHWLKLNFDLPLFDESEKEEEEEGSEDVKKLKKQAKKLVESLEDDTKAKKDVMQLFIKCYLFVYNVAQWIIYSSIGLLCLTRLFLYGQDSVSGTYDAVDTLMSLGQGLAFLEIIHPLLGFVRTGLLAPILQVASRNTVFFLFIVPFKEMHSKWTVAILLFDWSVAEFVRYPYYALSSFGAERKWITWLRYSCWMVLYPLGMMLEGAIGYQASVYIAETGFLSLQLPNPLNISFSLWPIATFYPVILAIGESPDCYSTEKCHPE
jgi:very-long-chain (3R)-3-hydroxyacyl-CoA dehydratase